MTPAPLSARRPAVAAGDLWRFAAEDRLQQRRSEETRRVVQVTRDRILCDNDSTAASYARGRYKYTRQWSLVSRPALTAAGDLTEDIGQWVWTPYYPHFRFPLVPGRRWRGSARVTNTQSDTTNVHRYQAEVLAAQTVTVPAGTFEVLPVRYEAQVASDDGAARLAWRNVELICYAPAARLFVLAEHQVSGPDGRPSRDSRLRLLEHRRAAA
jgi:hypothetical protein